MPTKNFPALLFLGTICLPIAFAQAPLPDLRIEPTGGGSFFYVKNTHTQPLTAWLIELVDYPGSSFAMWQDEITGHPIMPGEEKTIKVANMTVGAVPDYVKMRAAIYADGSTAGIPAKLTQLIERRRYTLETTRELIRRVEKATGKDDLIANLKQWDESLQPQGKPNRNSQAYINQEAGRGLIGYTVSRLQSSTPQQVLAGLKLSEQLLTNSKPAL
jgi:hypothetical protein